MKTILKLYQKDKFLKQKKIKNIMKTLFSLIFIVLFPLISWNQNYRTQVGSNTLVITPVKSKITDKTETSQKSSNRNKKVSVKINDVYIEPKIPSVEKGTFLDIKEISKDPTYDNVFSSISGFLENIWQHNMIAFAIGTRPPYNFFYNNGLPSVGYSEEEGDTFYSLGYNGEKKHVDVYIRPKRVRIGDSLKMHLYIYVYKQDIGWYKDGHPKKLVSSKLLATGSTLITGKSTIICVVHFNGEKWSLDLKKTE
jgi:hypothetical protein